MEYQENNKPMGVGDWVLTIFLTGIPLVGFIMLIIWAVSKEAPVSKSNWAKAMLIFYVIGFIFVLLFYGALAAIFLTNGGFDSL